MVDKELLVVMGLYLIGALLILIMAQAFHVTGILAWVILAGVLAPMPVLFLQRWLSPPESLVMLAAYWAMVVCVIAGLLLLVLAGLAGIRWVGLV